MKNMLFGFALVVAGAAQAQPAPVTVAAPWARVVQQPT
jgi:hypothetical protein